MTARSAPEHREQDALNRRDARRRLRRGRRVRRGPASALRTNGFSVDRARSESRGTASRRTASRWPRPRRSHREAGRLAGPCLRKELGSLGEHRPRERLLRGRDQGRRRAQLSEIDHLRRLGFRERGGVAGVGATSGNTWSERHWSAEASTRAGPRRSWRRGVRVVGRGRSRGRRRGVRPQVRRARTRWRVARPGRAGPGERGARRAGRNGSAGGAGGKGAAGCAGWDRRSGRRRQVRLRRGVGSGRRRSSRRRRA